jgi:isoleucyl-tRNA synthetase
MMVKQAPMRVLLGHGLVRDQWDRPMHKSAGNAIPFEGAADEGYTLKDPRGKEERYPPMSADLIRWLFSRSNPASNVDFGPGPAEELRSKFTLKLWNSYAFFCNYARLDGFDPNAPQVPIGQRPDIDRWILSDLQLLIQAARREFERFNIMAFCLEAEQFVDERLSNWYIRRNRRRFWKSEQSSDKLAAYQTLYTVLTTVAKLCAPVMPFLAEAIYQNLVARPAVRGAPQSVHLCDFPERDEKLLDADLSADVDALFRLVSLGSAARNSVKIKVRQPLAEMRVQPGNDRERRAVERFAAQICEELNIKKITLHDGAKGPLFRYEIKPNPKTLGPKFGPRLKAVQTALASFDPLVVGRRFQAGEPVELALEDGPAVLEPVDIFGQWKAPEGWAGTADRDTQVMIDVRITEALAQEGMAREVVRQVQDLRKSAGLQMEDRIVLSLQTDALAKAIQTHRDYICRETLAVEFTTEPLGKGPARTEVKVEGQALVIELKKVGS